MPATETPAQPSRDWYPFLKDKIHVQAADAIRYIMGGLYNLRRRVETLEEDSGTSGGTSGTGSGGNTYLTIPYAGTVEINVALAERQQIQADGPLTFSPPINFTGRSLILRITQTVHQVYPFFDPAWKKPPAWQVDASNSTYSVFQVSWDLAGNPTWEYFTAGSPI